MEMKSISAMPRVQHWRDPKAGVGAHAQGFNVAVGGKDWKLRASFTQGRIASEMHMRFLLGPDSKYFGAGRPSC